MLVLDFLMNSKLKVLNGISVESMECFNEDVLKKEKMKLSVNCR